MLKLKFLYLAISTAAGAVVVTGAAAAGAPVVGGMPQVNSKGVIAAVGFLLVTSRASWHRAKQLTQGTV